MGKTLPIDPALRGRGGFLPPGEAKRSPGATRPLPLRDSATFERRRLAHAQHIIVFNAHYHHIITEMPVVVYSSLNGDAHHGRLSL